MTTSRVVILASTPDGGSVSFVVHPLDLDHEDWRTRHVPLFELMAGAHPEAVWQAIPVPDGLDPREVLRRG